MTDDELEAIDARVRDAHPGPWTHEVSSHQNADGERIRHIGPRDGEGTICIVDSDFWTEDADAAFIAHAREDVPALVVELRRHRTALYKCERALSAIHRTGLPLTEDWPAEMTEAWDAAADVLYPDATVRSDPQ